MGRDLTLSAPEPLNADHQLSQFQCGEPALDIWLQRRALANQTSGASRTFVICKGQRVVGFHALASGSVRTAEAPGRFRRNMPEPIPVVVLARLAVAQGFHGRGVGRALFRDATLRVLQAADVIGIRGIVVQALTPAARDFYIALGMTPSILDPMLLLVTLAEVVAEL